MCAAQIQLIVTADDCGLSEGINLITLEHFQQGMVSAASLITTFPDTVQYAIEQLRQYPQLEIGVHLNLTEGKALTEVAKNSELTHRGGRFRDRLVLLAMALFPSDAMVAATKAELRAQIEVLVAAGIQPAHLTTHMHFHILPNVRKVIYELAHEYGVNWVRNSDVRQSLVPLNVMRHIDSDTEDIPHDFIVPDYLISLYHWIDHAPQRMLDELLKREGLVEIVLHPSYLHDPSFPRFARYKPAERQRESAYLQTFFELLQPYLGDRVVLSNSLGWGDG